MIHGPAVRGSTGLALAALSLVLVSWFSPVHAGEGSPDGTQFRPQGSLRIELIADAGPKTVDNGALLEEDTAIRFIAEVQGADYLYLLQRSNAGVEVLHPPTGQVFLAKKGPQVVVPHPPNLELGERPQGGYTAAGEGSFEFLLVASPVPRNFPSNSQLETVERLLAPPPYLTGHAAAPAVVLASQKITWGQRDE
ncbi:MAG TPA: hypothetical protein DIU15_09700 [Deltaproteobacteria bacterium]|nr:hypothetical protein [Deltaproteobacteria bacterium]HCP46305.1 hypothetical protein [Deltaproteobacteria bacterium]